MPGRCVKQVLILNLDLYKKGIKMFHMIHVQILKIVILYSKILYWYMTFLINLQVTRQKKLFYY